MVKAKLNLKINLKIDKADLKEKEENSVRSQNDSQSPVRLSNIRVG